MKSWGMVIVSLCLGLSAGAIENEEIRARGEDFCFEYVDGLALGSFHLLDCVSFVKTVALTPAESVQSFIEKLCNEVPTFYNLSDVASADSCIKAARNLGYF